MNKQPETRFPAGRRRSAEGAQENGFRGLGQMEVEA
jgi:hypothetical protein